MRKKRRKIKPRRWYIRPWIADRENFGHYEHLVPQLRERDPDTFRYFLRMEPEMFDEILQRIFHRIEKQDTNFKKALDPGLKLAVTLRFLATGESYRNLATGFLVAANSISVFVPDVCDDIIEEFMEETIVIPVTPEGWKEVAQGFASKWNFHHTIGAIDGKHIAIESPTNGGSCYHNYKGYHSLVLLGLVDAEGRFLYVDVGAQGSASDGGIFSVTSLRTALENDTAGVPDDDPLPGEDQPTPFFIVGDNAFPMRKFLQKPYSQRRPTPKMKNFNYRLSRARRVVEKAFGILAQRFRLFLTSINVRPLTVEKLVLTACILHNMLRNRAPNVYPILNPDVPATWQMDPLDGLQHPQRQSGPAYAKQVRDFLADFYMKERNLMPRRSQNNPQHS